MMSGRYQKLLQLLTQAREFAPEQRRSFLESACGGDSALAAEVDSIITAGESSGSFTLENPALGSDFNIDRVLDALDIEPPPRQIGNYRILNLLGRGGMGIVYKAEQQQPRRHVALKLIRPELATPKLLHRLEYEAEILARLRHAGIAQVYEAGSAHTERGRQSFVAMELVEGKPITAFAESRKLTLRQRIDLFIQVCESVQYAHQQGVIHRDLKPGNILVDSTGQPKIVDFGVARITQSDLQYATIQADSAKIVGTLQYMSPEQARGDSGSVDTRSDVYALGVVAFELLAARPPYSLKDKPLHEAALTIQEIDPPQLGTIDPSFKGDLEAIVGKALAKEKVSRYASAAELADDFRHWRNNEPITASGLGRWYRTQKFVRRNRTLVASAFAIVAVLVVGVLLTSMEALRATRAEKLAADRAQTMRRDLYSAEMMLAGQAVELPDGIGRATELLDHWSNSTPDLRGWEWYYLNSLCHADLLTYRGHNGIVWSIAWAKGSDLLASGGNDGVIKIWHAETGKDVMTIQAHHAAVRSLAWSPKHQRVASQGEDQTIEIWDTQSGQKLLEIPCHRDGTRPARSLAWSPDGVWLAASDAAFNIGVWNTTDGSQRLSLHGHTGGVQSVAWSPDGTRLLSASADGTARIWDAQSGNQLLTFAAHRANARYAAWSPDGKQIASSGDDNLIRVWDSSSGKERLNYRAHSGGAISLAWSPDGNRLASTSRQDSIISVWDITTNKESATFRGHGAGAVLCVIWNDQGTRLASCGEDGVAKVWDTQRPSADLLLKGHTRNIQSAAWSPDGNQLASCGYDKTLRIWDSASGKLLHTIQAHEGQVTSVAWSHDGQRLLTSGDDHTVKCWDAASGTLVFSLTDFKGPVSSVAWSPDGKHFAASGLQDPVHIWDQDGHEPRVINAQGIRVISWNPQGTRLAGGGDGHGIHIWDAAAGNEVKTISTPAVLFYALCWSPDGQSIGIGMEDGTARIFDAASGNNVITYRGHTSGVLSMSWSPDGSRIASACREQTLQIWSPQSGAELLLLHNQDSPAAWSPDGRQLVSEAVGNVLDIRSGSTARVPVATVASPH